MGWRGWTAMYGGWAEYDVLSTHFLGFIRDIKNVSTTNIHWVWSQSRRSKS